MKPGALPPVRSGATLEVDIHGLGHAGEGVGRYQGFTLFVPGGLPGERVRARVTEVKPAYGRGRLLEVLTPAAGRTSPRCPVFGQCGGCQLQHLSYPQQLQAKHAQVVAALERIGKLAQVTVHPTLGMADPWHYRNKAQVPVGLSGRDLVMGFYAPESHRIVDTDVCYIQHPIANAALAEVRRLVSRYGVSSYDESTHTGVLRHVLIRTSARADTAMVVLVTNGRQLPAAKAIADELMAAVSQVVSVWQNVNDRRTNVVLGEQNIHLAGVAGLVDWIGDLRFEISPPSFFQVNPVQTEQLYRQAVAYAALAPDDVAVDVYCGIGTISLFLARQAAYVHGIEEVAAAVADARRNAGANGLANVRFAAGPAEVLLPRLAADGVRPAAVVLDPPRKGCERVVLVAAAAMGPRRIVYVSCNPSTLARDLAVLAEQGYVTREVQPVDMFPHTAHVECCALLVRAGG